jgi:hypothetical protein
LAVAAGWLWSRRPDRNSSEVNREYEPKNPLELRAALLFAALFLAVLIVTHLAVVYLGKTGVYVLAALMGVSDVDPFIMGMTQSAGSMTPVSVAAAAIVIAASSNNVAKRNIRIRLGRSQDRRPESRAAGRARAARPCAFGIVSGLKLTDSSAHRALCGLRVPRPSGSSLWAECAVRHGCSKKALIGSFRSF